jgi:hypothetical protein
VKLDEVRGFHQEAGSPDVCFASSLGSELIHGRKVLFFEIGVFFEDLGLTHSGAKPSQDVPNANAQPANTRLSATFTRLDRNPSGLRRHVASGYYYDTRLRPRGKALRRSGRLARALVDFAPYPFFHRRMLVDSAATAATTTMVAAPPKTTDGTVPIKAAATPDSTAPH